MCLVDEGVGGLLGHRLAVEPRRVHRRHVRQLEGVHVLPGGGRGSSDEQATLIAIVNFGNNDPKTGWMILAMIALQMTPLRSAFRE